MPDLQIPRSDVSVDVRIIDTGTLLYLNSSLFWQPASPDFPGLHAPGYCFLVSHPRGLAVAEQHHIIFDLGTRPDWENYAPTTVSLIKRTTIVTPGTDVEGILNDDASNLNLRADEIGAVIWSHNHFDHVGDTSKFPPSTELVVGPGVPAACASAHPSKEDAMLLESDTAGRKTREITFERGHKQTRRIGRFDAYDYFGDGSFYLLDAPGHCKGHICGLARTNAGGESDFVFMGADACHHVGVLRPSKYLPLPEDVAAKKNLVAMTLDGTAGSAFFEVADGPLFPDHRSAMVTVGKIQELDAAQNVFVIMAHDLSLREYLPVFPTCVNGWKKQDLKHRTRWLFLKDLLS